MVLAFESGDHPLEPWMKRALECCADHGGRVPKEDIKSRTDQEATHEGAAGAWRNAFLNAPYLMDTVAAMGMVSDTFETSITWDRFENFHNQVMETARDAMRRICGKGSVTCRFTHVYPDGPAPYYTFLGAGQKGFAARAARRSEAGRLGSSDEARRHHHASSCGRARSSPMVRPPASRRFRECVARGQEGARSARHFESGSFD